jgi:hypothetical protein
MDVFIVLEPDEAMPPAENIIGVFASLEAALYFAAGKDVRPIQQHTVRHTGDPKLITKVNFIDVPEETTKCLI